MDLELHDAGGSDVTRQLLALEALGVAAVVLVLRLDVALPELVAPHGHGGQLLVRMVHVDEGDLHRHGVLHPGVHLDGGNRGAAPRGVAAPDLPDVGHDLLALPGAGDVAVGAHGRAGHGSDDLVGADLRRREGAEPLREGDRVALAPGRPAAEIHAEPDRALVRRLGDDLGQPPGHGGIGDAPLHAGQVRPDERLVPDVDEGRLVLDVLPALVGPGDVADGVLHGLGGDVLEVAAALAVLLADRGHEGEVGAAFDELAPLLAGQRAALEADRLSLHVQRSEGHGDVEALPREQLPGQSQHGGRGHALQVLPELLEGGVERLIGELDAPSVVGRIVDPALELLVLEHVGVLGVHVRDDALHEGRHVLGAPPRRDEGVAVAVEPRLGGVGAALAGAIVEAAAIRGLP
mmetsp:Transcript_54345/g.159835  ORF Transcript_54345/g.159835 Transcript_54345/m.159835 type:complete len:406 (+) Transcript_54345:750-1967(+)